MANTMIIGMVVNDDVYISEWKDKTPWNSPSRTLIINDSSNLLLIWVLHFELFLILNYTLLINYTHNSYDQKINFIYLLSQYWTPWLSDDHWSAKKWNH